MELRDRMLDSAKHFCDFIGSRAEVIRYTEWGNDKSVTFGDCQDNAVGLRVYVGACGDGEIDRIIMSDGDGLWIETREQKVLTAFLHKDPYFLDWMGVDTEQIK